MPKISLRAEFLSGLSTKPGNEQFDQLSTVYLCLQEVAVSARTIYDILRRLLKIANNFLNLESGHSALPEMSLD
jgi:hypothetical protein